MKGLLRLRKQPLIGLMTLIGVIGILIGGYYLLRRTLIADLREAVIAPDTQDPLEYGAILFQTRGCTSCHTLDRAGSSGDEAPDLSGLPNRADADYVRESITDPTAVIATGCPDGPCEPIMPDYGAILKDKQVDALVVYLMATPEVVD